MGWYSYKPYVSATQRKARARREVSKRENKGETLAPVIVEGLKMGQTFWGQAWCKHIETLSDLASRLPRGKTYVRNESILDLQIRKGLITAMVMGNELYTIRVKITPLAVAQWQKIKRKTAGQIGSMVELLQGRLSDSVMQSVTGQPDGLFPKSGQIEMECTCEDNALMCKHLAAVLYGVGCRLDEEPDLLFKLRGVDHRELITEATNAAGTATLVGNRKVIATGDLSAVFGIELDTIEPDTQIGSDIKISPDTQIDPENRISPDDQISPTSNLPLDK